MNDKRSKKRKPKRAGIRKGKGVKRSSKKDDTVPVDIDDEVLSENIQDLEMGIFFTAEAAIEEANRFNCDVTEAQLYLEKGRAQFKMGNFDYADNYCQLALNSAKESSKKVRAEELFHEIAKIIKDNAELYSNIDNIEQSYRQAENYFDTGKFDETIETLEGIKNEAIDIIFDNIVSETESKLQNLAEKIRKYKSKGINIGEPLEILTKANESFDENDYLSANELAEEASKTLNVLVEPELKTQATEIMKKLDKLRTSDNLDEEALKEAEPFFKDIEKSFESGHYEIVIEHEKELSEIAERIIKIGKLTEYQMIQEKIKELDKNLKETESSGVDVTEIHENLDKAKSAIESKNIQISKEWLSKAQKMNDKIKDKFVEKKVQSIIFSAQSLINEISETGANVDEAEKRLKLAKKLLSERDFDESRKIAEQTIMIARETLVGHISRRAELMMTKNQKLLQELSNREIDSSELEKLFYQAQNAHKNEDFTEAIEILTTLETTALKLLNVDLSNQVTGNLRKFEQRISEAREFDIPVDEFVLVLEDVKLKLESENYLEAESIIAKNLEELNSKLKDLSIRKKLNEILDDIETIRNLGGGVKRLEALSDRASGALNKGNLSSAEETINKLFVATKKNLTETYSLQVGKQLRNLEKKIQVLKDQRISVSEIEIIYNDAVEALRNRDYESALKLLNKGDDLIEGLVEEDQTIKLKEDLEGIISKIGELKLTGINVEKLESAVSNAKKKIEENDNNKARELLRQIEIDMKSQMESKKVLDLLNEIETEMKEVKLMGVNVTKLEDAYTQAIKAMKTNEMRRATEIARDISSIITMIKKDRLKHQALELYEKVERELKNALEQNLTVENSEELVVRAKDAFKRNEYEDSIKFSRQVEDILKKEERSKLVLNIQRKLEVFEFELEQAGNQGLDISQFNKSLNDVKTLLEEGKPNPAQDVLNFAQRSFKKTLTNFKEQKDKGVPDEQLSKPAKIEAEVVASSSPVITEDINDIEDAKKPMDDLSIEEPPVKEGKVTDENSKKFKSLGSVGLKTLEKIKMSAKANNVMELDSTETMEDAPFTFADEELEKRFGTDPGKTGHELIAKGEVIDSQEATKEWVTEAYENHKKELERSKAEEKFGFKANLSQLESLLNASNLAIEESNYKTAKKFLIESSEVIDKNIKPSRIKFILTRFKKDIEDLWSSGEKIGKAESVLSKARKSFESNDLAEADSHLEQLDEIITKFKDEKLKVEVREKIKSTQKKLKSLEKLGADASKIQEIKDLREKAKKSLVDKKISKAFDLISQVSSKVDALEHNYWNDKLGSERSEIEDLMNKIREVDETALDSKYSDNLIKADNLFESRSYRKALKVLKDSKKALGGDLKKIKEKVKKEPKKVPERKDIKKAQVALEKVVGKLITKPEELKEEEEKVEPEVSEKKLEVKPEQELKIEKEKTDTKPINIPIAGPLSEGIEPETYSRNLITDVVLLLQQMRTENVDVNEPEILLQQAKEEFICKSYENANDMAIKARDMLIRLKPEMFKDQAERDIEDIKLYFEELKKIGVETEPLERNMKIINDDFENHEFVKVRESCERLKSKAKRVKTEFLKVTLKPKIQDLMSEVAEKKKIGIEVEEIESYLADAEDSISENDYDGAIQIYEKALDLFEAIPDEDERKRLDLIEKVESLKATVKSKSYNLDFSSAEKMFQGIDEKLNAGEMENAEKGIAKAEEKINGILREYTLRILERVQLEIEDIGFSGADTTTANELVNKGKKLMDANEFNEALITFESAERMAIDTGDSFVKIFEGLRKLSRQMSQISKDSDTYNEILKLRNETKQKLEEKDYISALTTLNKANSLLQKLDPSLG